MARPRKSEVFKYKVNATESGNVVCETSWPSSFRDSRVFDDHGPPDHSREMRKQTISRETRDTQHPERHLVFRRILGISQIAGFNRDLTDSTSSSFSSMPFRMDPDSRDSRASNTTMLRFISVFFFFFLFAIDCEISEIYARLDSTRLETRDLNADVRRRQCDCTPID
ncbi:hypothetical protein P5V15_013256 [Pogonomyrmex californicus]